MKKTFVIIGILLVVSGAGAYVWQKYKGAAPAVLPPSGNIGNQLPTVTPASNAGLPDSVNQTSIPLTLPKGFTIAVAAKNLSGARVIAQDKLGNLWVSRTGPGVVTELEIKDGQVVSQSDIFKGLNKPHGLAIDPEDGLTLYIAEENKISKVRLYKEDGLHKIIDLPKGGRHFTRTLGFGPDGRLYVSIGSTCDVCNEKDERYAAIYSMNKDGSDFKKVATGLRNSAFFTWSYVDGRMWATEMGRDNLGDDLPPDEINIIEVGPSTSSGQNSIPNFGWPICYGNNVHDTNFDKNTYIQNPCNGKIAPKVELPAHSAPLGLAFVPEEGWPEAYWYNLIVAFHGSWNRTQPTGYKLMRIKLDGKGNYLGMEDFISGWLAKDGKTSLGRPVDVFIMPGGVMYVTDDKAGVIYKVSYRED